MSHRDRHAPPGADAATPRIADPPAPPFAPPGPAPATTPPPPAPRGRPPATPGVALSAAPPPDRQEQLLAFAAEHGLTPLPDPTAPPPDRARQLLTAVLTGQPLEAPAADDPDDSDP